MHLLGSPTHHIARDKGCPEAIYPCEACGLPTPTLWKTSYKYPHPKHLPHRRPYYITALDKLLKTTILPAAIQREPTARGHDPHAQRTAKIIRTLTRHSTTLLCYTCAIPIILERRQHLFSEAALAESDCLLKDIRAIAQGEPSALEPLHGPPPPRKHPWATADTQPLIGEIILLPSGQHGQIIAIAPTPHTAP